MADLATLGLEVKSDQVVKATNQLDVMSGAGKRAEAAMKGLAGANQNGSGAARVAAAALDRETVSAKAAAAALMQASAAARMAANNQRMLAFQLNDIATMLAMGASPFQILASQGGQVLQIYQGQGGVKQALKDTMGMVTGVATKFPLLTAAVIAGSAAIAGMQYEMNQAGGTAVSFADVALGAFQVIADGAYSVLKPAIDAIAPWFASAWDLIVSGVKVAGNTFIGAWIAQIEAVKFAVKSIPDAFIVAGEEAANGFLKGIDWLVNKALDGFAKIIEGAQKLSELLGADWVAERFGWTSPSTWLEGFKPEGGFKSPPVDIGGGAARDRLAAGWDGMVGAMGAGFGRNWMGEFFDAVKINAVANAMDKAAESTKKAGDAAKGAGNGWKHFGNEARRAAEDMIRNAQELANNFVSDLRAGLQEGEGIWKSFANAAMNALDSIMGKLLEMATNSLVTTALASMFGGQFLSPRAWGAIQSGVGLPYAGGGMVYGPGSGTSDSIPARLSNGEFVVRAAAVAQPGVRSLLENINGFADGGLVRDPGVFAGEPGGFGERLAA